MKSRAERILQLCGVNHNVHHDNGNYYRHNNFCQTVYFSKIEVMFQCHCYNFVTGNAIDIGNRSMMVYTQEVLKYGTNPTISSVADGVLDDITNITGGELKSTNEMNSTPSIEVNFATGVPERG